ncbi:MAG TPA: FHA domain-containing protein [Anaerolineaceae bacterium]|nr:FHA domain-containing protein [Anaerolineaceae bacterium]
MEKGKWIVRGDSLLFIMCFFIPSVLVSCSSGFMDVNQPFSLSTLADQGASSLNLIPVLAIGAIVFTILKSDTPTQKQINLWGQICAFGSSVLVLLFSILSLQGKLSQVSMGAVEIKTTFGTYLLIAAMIAFGVGWAMQFRESPKNSPEVRPQEDRLIIPPAKPYQPPEPRISFAGNTPGNSNGSTNAHLEPLSKNVPGSIVYLIKDSFSIGRSKENDLCLPDPSVSRRHVVLRNAQGSWYLQDQDSSGGSFVNGRQEDAIRLSDGDEITVGPFQYRFRAGN